MTPEYELNEILWKSVRGSVSLMPPPVRAGFIRIIDDDDDRPGPKDDDDDEDEKEEKEESGSIRWFERLFGRD